MLLAAGESARFSFRNHLLACRCGLSVRSHVVIIGNIASCAHRQDRLISIALIRKNAFALLFSPRVLVSERNSPLIFPMVVCQTVATAFRPMRTEEHSYEKAAPAVGV